MARRRRQALVMVVVAGLSLSLLLTLWVGQSASHQASALEHAQLTRVRVSAQSLIDEFEASLLAAGRMLKATDPPTRAQFDAVAQPMLDEMPGVLAIGWAPRAVDDDGQTLERIELKWVAKRGIGPEVGANVAAHGPCREAVRVSHRERAMSLAMMEPKQGKQTANVFLAVGGPEGNAGCLMATIDPAGLVQPAVLEAGERGWSVQLAMGPPRGDAPARRPVLTLALASSPMHLALTRLPVAAPGARWGQWVVFFAGVGLTAVVAVLMGQGLSRQAWIEHLTEHDELTGLPNRRALRQAMRRAMQASDRGRPHALLMVDLDNFKLINDAVGHASADRFLVNISQMFVEQAEPGDVVTHIGGDEFALVVVGDYPRARARAEALRQSISRMQYQHEGHVLETTSSIGIAMLAGSTAAQALTQAEAAMRDAKAVGGNRVYPETDADLSHAGHAEASRWATRISDALHEERLMLHFQPVVRLADDQPVFYESLIRMVEHDGQLIAAGAFIEAAERFGIIGRIDHWVIDQSLRLLEAHPHMQLFVNVSASSLLDGRFLEHLEAQLRSLPNVHGRLVLELTERQTVRDMKLAADAMKRLKQLGCRFAIDDFGTGFSSLTQLYNLPVDYLKIDGSFVRQLDADGRSRALVEAITRAAQSLGVTTIAEFVETTSVSDLLKQIGVHFGQGRLYGMPDHFDTTLAGQQPAGSDRIDAPSDTSSGPR